MGGVGRQAQQVPRDQEQMADTDWAARRLPGDPNRTLRATVLRLNAFSDGLGVQ